MVMDDRCQLLTGKNISFFGNSQFECRNISKSKTMQRLDIMII